MHKIILTREARENIALLPGKLQEAVAATIEAISIDPRKVGKPLVSRLSGYWSARVGNYRVIYTIEESPRSASVMIRVVRHRGVVYKGKRR